MGSSRSHHPVCLARGIPKVAQNKNARDAKLNLDTLARVLGMSKTLGTNGATIAKRAERGEGRLLF